MMKMMKTLSTLCLLSILLAVVPVAAQNQPAHSTTIWFGTEVSIAPDTDGEGLWKCQAQLEDLGSGEVLSAPSIVFAEGEAASVQSSLTAGMLWELKVEVAAGGDEAHWSSNVSLGDQVLSVATGTVQLVSR